MNNPEHDRETPPDVAHLSPPADATETPASGAAAAGAEAADLETRAREQRKAIEDETIEGEHLDYFLEHVSDPNR